MTLVAKMLMFCSFVLVAAVSFYVLMKKSCSKKIRYIPPIEDVLLKPEQITANIFSYKTPLLFGYPLTILSYICCECNLTGCTHSSGGERGPGYNTTVFFRLKKKVLIFVFYRCPPPHVRNY